MRNWLLICFSFANSLFAQIEDIAPVKNLRIPIIVQNMILGADSQDFRGYFRDTSSIFAIKFNAVKTYKDSAGIHITYGTGRYWFRRQITTFHFALYPITYKDTIARHNGRILNCDFMVRLTSDSLPNSGIAICHGRVDMQYVSSTNIMPWSFYFVQGYLANSSPFQFGKKENLFWSSEPIFRQRNDGYFLTSRELKTKPITGGGGWGSSYGWPLTTMFPPKDWFKTE